MNENVLVNKSFDAALKKYIALEKNNLLNQCNDTMITIIRSLIIIYGDLDIINPHITKDTKALIENLAKYGYAKSEVIAFLNCLNNVENYDFVEISKQIIDMYYLKSKIINVIDTEKSDLLHILSKAYPEDLDKSTQLKIYFEQKFSGKSIENNIEFLEVEPNFIEKEEKNKRFSFQLDAVGGFVSIMTILITIALVCVGVVIINILVG